MTQFQVSRTDSARTRLVDVPEEDDRARLGDGDALVRIDRFGLSANNITYVVLGDRLGYWRFFPAVGDGADEWGVMPVWGFGDVLASRATGLEVGERLFGYFPPATHLVIRPAGAADRPVVDVSSHRAELPRGYNLYQRVLDEPGYHRADDAARMLLFPLYLTSWAIWDTLAEATWSGAEQIVIVSASSKTAIGLGHALAQDPSAPPTVAVTSARNRAFVEGLGLYGSVVDYEEIETIGRSPSVVVDMAGSGVLLGRLHRHLDEAMVRSVNVGLTHWDEAGGGPDIIRDRSELFFAPGVIQKRVQEWGAEEFGRRSQSFVREASRASRDWLALDAPVGLDALAALYGAVRDGSMAPDRGLVIAPDHGPGLHHL